MNAKQIFKVIKSVLSVAGILAAVISWYKFGPFVKSANSVKKLNDHFYYMEFSGDYQLDKLLEQGGVESNSEMAVYIEQVLRGKKIHKVFKEEVPLNTGCAAISSFTPEGEKVFGRNYDWNNLTSAMIIKCNPKHGYKSISTTQLDFIGFGEGYRPEKFGSRYLAAAGIYVPLDGMNEKGLCISDLMAGDTEETNQDSGKCDVTTTLAIRGILDFCADVSEAIEFLKNHDMHSVIGYAHHFAISDASGRMVVAEYIDNQLVITEANALTNHYLGGKDEADFNENSVYRLRVLNQRLEEKGRLTEDDMKQVLYDIRASQFKTYSKTWWRIIFNQNNLTATYSLEENYESLAEFNFKL
ncbi:MAG: C45 family autoproteolytic acyltransferase/hydrolase [Treponema sp.]|nr:C45 family autoproteolytic acyltransferase/hydrolase [Treponema sp.]